MLTEKERKTRRRSYYDKKRDDIITKAKEWNKNNPDKHRKANQEWLKSHPDYFTNYRKTHKKEAVESVLRWRKKYPDRYKKLQKKYSKN
jgi:hypothetical protein